MNFIARGWKGDERLWKVTWLGYLGGGFILALVAFGLYAVIPNATKYIISPAVLALNVWGLVAMWRCARNVNWKGWMYLARIAVVLTAIVWALEVAGVIEE